MKYKIFEKIQHFQIKLESFNQNISLKLKELKSFDKPQELQTSQLKEKEYIEKTGHLLDESQAFLNIIGFDLRSTSGSFRILDDVVVLDGYVSDDKNNIKCVSKFIKNEDIVNKYVQKKDEKDLLCLSNCLKDVENVLLILNKENISDLQTYNAVEKFHNSLKNRMKEYRECCDITILSLESFKQTLSESDLEDSENESDNDITDKETEDNNDDNKGLLIKPKKSSNKCIIS
ncbi:hypothetical protein AB837_00511 [bacterium AB1]|nr:hypothetical protein AB837_00511 [bacterium AB1]